MHFIVALRAINKEIKVLERSAIFRETIKKLNYKEYKKVRIKPSITHTLKILISKASISVDCKVTKDIHFYRSYFNLQCDAMFWDMTKLGLYLNGVIHLLWLTPHSIKGQYASIH